MNNDPQRMLESLFDVAGVRQALWRQMREVLSELTRYKKGDLKGS